MTTFADRIISFYREISFDDKLPEGISLMNPFRDNPQILDTISMFYRKYYSDNRKRHLIMGINPGRFGAGATGIPFTDTIRLESICGISLKGMKTYETSSVFMYEMIDRYGGPEKFYGDHYISSVSPLGFTAAGKKGAEVNYNYYDNRELTESIMDFILVSLRKQIDFGIYPDTCFCLGTGKNYKFISELNRKYKFFERIVPLEHPRFIMQYRLKKKELYINNYISRLRNP
ncbi:MAG TPA: DUF4918 family protein [Bacteroidales bacterium]|jgi:hypothetical protein|nr:DUF4918 family protein [Bacteroidales bacterium]HOX74533.1 DUF4918 family protein [Bacteroidales bacterium]HPM86357.1 DUF4918 family protein [Bacteroidales bacterium]HQM68568.1 DUF4918 family protein [Bacteroidales bacterium]